MNKRISFRIHGGIVQGVFFRKHTQTRAQEFGVTGWIQNIAGEKIEGEAQGDENALQEMVKEIKTGPPNAVVVKVETEDIPVVEGEKEFVVKRTVR
ncbi:hypothetical protein VC83_08008 [Pseudogymnoascus destructans]|uniref:acylphosphatase n=2 Tax=Pseudogymnoascus destructans TaxID=655981 RepID=L8G1C1_PSED2|nr:uncharacterized protein VC83_08008 [Pseudogymnoascus destructans]ELR06574.1 acylphosphatase [Pseudogymnoascus destructans 20631-21]OAF55935.1 hypothetical protein VC83_08008 [Pseudogymnoascus destructans]